MMLEAVMNVIALQDMLDGNAKVSLLFWPTIRIQSLLLFLAFWFM